MNFFKIVGVIVVGLIALWLVGTVVHFVWSALHLIVPLAIVGGVGYVVYRIATKDRRSLTGGGGRYLP